MTDKILYIEANTGISGDMFVASLLDLADDSDGLKEKLEKVLATIPISGFDIRISVKKRAGIDVCDFDVVLDAGHENHDHDMEYLYGHEQGHTHPHMHEHDDKHNDETGHTHDHDHEHDHHHAHHHDHVHRGMKEIKEILEQTEMTSGARSLAIKIFEILGKAESQAHGVPVDEVHFHEVGAVDSIVDIVSAAVCVDALSPNDVIISPLAEGTGTVRTMHGILPVPVPAVSHIIANEGLIIHQNGMRGEFITPTGAAIAAAIRTSDNLPDSFTIEKTGIGGGKRAYDPPSMVRAMWLKEIHADDTPSVRMLPDQSCEYDSDTQPDKTSGTIDESSIWKLETDIDDCTGEDMGRVMELLYNAGAREVHFSPIFMKKNRPAYELTVITTSDLVEKTEGIIFKNTTTIGIRRQQMERTVLSRKPVEITTKYGSLLAKQVALPDGEVRIYPEYESLKELSEKTGVSIIQLKEILGKF
ncbi:MAG: LarC family nickel insertion protein [Eubacterium sp.]|nr:LarC family nickel insertion protein [Eubacterium sp.]